MVERKNYTPEFQRMVAKAYYTSDKSVGKISKEFNVKRGTVSSWVQRYRSDYQQARSIHQQISTFNSVINTDTAVKKKKLSPEQMEQRIQELEAQLKQEQMRSVTLDTMIDIAEQELQIPIRKKPGAKQSK